MNHDVSPQHPAVVLRSQYLHLRALLAIAGIAVVALAAAVVVLASNNGHTGTIAGPATPIITPVQKSSGSATTRFDGGPEEGTRGVLPAQRSANTRFDGGPEEGTRGAGH